MHVVIMGCGRVGSLLAIELEANGHSVAVIDQAKEAFRRLGPDFKGRTITGVGFDRDTLLEAGIEGADAFAAVSNGDNSNILAARVARESYGVTNVVARIYDPGRAEIYQRLGIPTVATVIWATDQIMRRLTRAAREHNISSLLHQLGNLSEYHFEDRYFLPNVFINDARDMAAQLKGSAKVNANANVAALMNMLNSMEL